MSSVIRKLCCCNGNDNGDGGGGADGDEDPLITDTDDDGNGNGDGNHFRTTANSNATGHFWVNNGDTRGGTSHSMTNNSRGTGQQTNNEDEILNQILETAQQNIIDVANMDGTATPCKEDLSKAQRYSDAIKQHDLKVRKHSPNPPSAVDSCLLFDVGQRVVELLQQPAQPFAAHSELREFAKNMSDALINSIQIEHKQDILVHMSFSDE